jgi:ammonium transporter, Amt family
VNEGLLFILATFFPSSVMAEETAVLNSGDTAWMLTATSRSRLFFVPTIVKRSLAYDDSLDVFGIHAIGGIIGAVLTGVFCAESLDGAGFGVDITSIGGQVTVQILGIGVTLIYTGIMGAFILKVVDGIMGLRVSNDEAMEGLDLTLHNERGYIISGS